MAELVNLRQQRKMRAREEKARQAEANRARHGRSKAERREREAIATLETQRLDGKRRVRDDS